MKIKPVCLAVCLMAAIPLCAQDLPIKNIIDDSSLRILIKDSWFTESPARVLARRSVIHNLPGGGRVELRTEAGTDEFMVVLARELGGALRNVAGNFPGWAQGSWMLSRDRVSGEARRIRVFLRSDPNMFIQFRPLGSDKSQMDVVLYDAYIRRSLPLPVPLERLFTLPLADVLAMAGERFPQKYFEPNPAYSRDKRALIGNIRKGIVGLEFADDGALDEYGNYVYIETGLAQQGKPGLNCSGFSKWVIDSMLFPLTGKNFAIGPLKAPFGQRGSSFTEPWEELYDPYFGLDWIRNLASGAASVLRSPAFGTLDEIEVRTEPFSQMISRRGRTPTLTSYPGFLENAGYGIEGLLPLLYTLAIDEPARFYLAAVNNEMGPATTQANPRGRPRMRKYFHVAVLIPYFNDYGVFQVAVFESAAETSITAFRSRYPGQYANLVRVPVYVF